MATKRKSAGGTAGKTGATARADKAAAVGSDRQARQSEATEAAVSAMPHNANKPLEYGRDAAYDPPAGETVELPPEVSGSTLAEGNENAKTGGVPAPGDDPTTRPLDRVRVDASGRPLTTNQGVLVADNQHSLKAGLRGPALLKDFILREKITHFDHERIPERIVHARGSGAHGVFTCYEALDDITRAAPFQAAGKETPVFVRFSTVQGERGSKDTARDVRGFAVKFYTDEGNWDLVGNNMPVFFIQDAMKFPDLVHAVKPEPHNAMPQAASAHDTFWDFVSLMPESAHMLLWAMSDRGIPRSYRMMQGFGVHTFRFVNAAGASQLVKFHWTPILGTHALVWDEAVKISGADPDFHRRDLWDAIEAGEYPEYELGVQVFTEEDAENFSFDVLDATKIVPEELVPVRPIGRLVLNRNPDNFFAETEQVAFCTAHVVPGIDFTNDPLLAGRIHSYVDTQITRLGGPNFHEIPINAPIAPVHNNQRDGMHRQAIHRGRVSYEPNSLGGGCPFQAGTMGFVPFPEPIADDELRGHPEKFAEHYNQATLFFESQTPSEQQHIINAFRFELSKLTVPAIRARVVALLRNVSDVLAQSVADGLGIALPEPLPRATNERITPEVTRSPTLSMFARPGRGIRSRRVAIFVANGVDGDAIDALRDALAAEGAVGRLVGPRVGPFTTAQGEVREADAAFDTEPSVVFDGLAIPGGNDAIATLARDGRAVEFVRDQFRHCKTILALGAGAKWLADASLPSTRQDPGLLMLPDATPAAGAEAFIAALAMHRHFVREKDPPAI